MCNSTSKTIVDNQPFVIRAMAHVVQNGKPPAVVKKQILRDINTYLNSFMFENLLRQDLNYSTMDPTAAIRIIINTVSASDRFNLVTIRGIIRVDKPKMLTYKHSPSNIRGTLKRLLVIASIGHKYPINMYGHSLGPEPDRLSLRFSSWTTRVTLSSPL